MLSDGQLIPAGCIIEVPSYDYMHDPGVIENPDEFDAFRWYRQRQAQEHKRTNKVSTAATQQLVSISPISLHFGYGRHACPGRFFAANEMKMIVGRALLDYDIKLPDGEKERYKNLEFAGAVSLCLITLSYSLNMLRVCIFSANCIKYSLTCMFE